MTDRTTILKTIEHKLNGEIAAHKMNIDILLNNPVGVAEHIDFVETIEKELDKLAELDDRLEALTKYFY